MTPEGTLDLTSEHAPLYSYRHHTPSYSDSQRQQPSPRDLPRLFDSIQSLRHEVDKKSPECQFSPGQWLKTGGEREQYLEAGEQQDQLRESASQEGVVTHDSPACLDSQMTDALEHVLGACGASVVETTDKIGSHSSPSLELVFDANGEARHLILQRRPFGAEFGKSLMGPVRIRKVHPNSYASELGVQPSWVIKFVGSEDVSKKSLASTQKVLKNGMMLLPESSKQ